MNPRSVAIIPARGGSKRIARKNVRPFAGRPIIEWSIEAARESGLFARVIVSTDDDEIAALARDAGAEAPFVRPPELSDDHAGTMPVIAHAIGWLATNALRPDLVCCLYATAPFVDAALLAAGRDALLGREAEFAFAAVRYDYPIQRALRVDEDGIASMFDPRSLLARSQELEPAWHDAGQFYWGSADAFESGRHPFAARSCVVPVPSYRVQDIDDEDDWIRAELMFEAWQRGRP